MHHEIDVIEQHPFSLAIAFNVRRPLTGFLQSQLDFVGDGLNLPRIGAAADHKVIGECSRIFFEFEDGKFLGLLVLTGGNGFGNLGLEIIFFHAEVGEIWR